MSDFRTALKCLLIEMDIIMNSKSLNIAVQFQKQGIVTLRCMHYYVLLPDVTYM